MSLSRLRLSICLAVLLPLAPSSAQAGDFTGFYAGVNAGYAFDRDGRERAGPVALPDAPASGRTETGLPPSASSASQAPMMRPSRSARSPQR